MWLLAGAISVAAAYDLPSLPWGDIWWPLPTFEPPAPGAPHAFTQKPAGDAAAARVADSPVALARGDDTVVVTENDSNDRKITDSLCVNP